MILVTALATFILIKNNTFNKNNDTQDDTIYETSLSTNETLNTDSQTENATQKIMRDKFFSSGKITKIV